MAYIVADRVKETSTTTGTGALTLAGAVTNFRAFSAVCVNGDVVPYAIVHQTAAEWEVGFGTWGTGGTLTRTTILSSSNAGAATNFSAGTKDVFCTAPATCIPEEENDLFMRGSDNGRLILEQSAISILAANFTGSNATGAQPFFPTTQDEFTLKAGTTYIIEGHISTNRAAGTTSHTTSVLFGGTATFTQARYSCACRYGARSASTPIRPYIGEYTGTAPSTAQVVSTASTIVQSKVFDFDGVLVVNAGGTIIPQFQYSAAPGGAPTIERGSFFKVTPIGPAATAVIGAIA